MRGQLRTASYSDEARARLGGAVAKAREAAGYKYRTEFARAAGIKSVRSLEMLEAGEPGVGQSVLFAVGRALPNWTEDTPRVILEGGPIPSTANEPEPVPEHDEDAELREMVKSVRQAAEDLLRRLDERDERDKHGRKGA